MERINVASWTYNINSKPDYKAGIESRGFITASAITFKYEIGFIPIRKTKKLTGKIKL